MIATRCSAVACALLIGAGCDGGADGLLPAVTQEDLLGVDGRIAVGTRGTILRGDFSGKSWAQVQSGTTEDLFGVCTEELPWVVVGARGTILTSEDGMTWTVRASGVTTDLFGVDRSDASSRYAVGAAGVILFSADGGSTWVPQASGTRLALYGVEGFDQHNLLPVFAVGEGGVVLKTENARDWKTVRQSGEATLRAVSFPNTYCQNIGPCFRFVAVGDRGYTVTGLYVGPLEEGRIGDDDLRGVSDDVDRDTGWAVGRGGSIFRWGGYPDYFVRSPSPTTAQLNAVSKPHPRGNQKSAGGVAVGERGTMFLLP